MVMPLVVGLGEILWDMLPEGRQLGGAPANFACHAGRLGADSVIVSAVGEDDLGSQISQRLDQMGLRSDYVAKDSDHPTGTVDVQLDAKGHPSYVIHEGVAWDCIKWSESIESLAEQADAVCFGTLCQRCAVSHKTIQRFLAATKKACLRIFDVNLRQHYYDEDILIESLKAANVVKLNDEELPVVGKLLSFDGGSPREALIIMMELFDLKAAAMTRGANGSIMILGHDVAECAGVNVVVKDTVGAGDSFSAAMAMGMLRSLSVEQINNAACRIGAYVCSQAGAVPELPDERVHLFKG